MKSTSVEGGMELRTYSILIQRIKEFAEEDCIKNGQVAHILITTNLAFQFHLRFFLYFQSGRREKWNIKIFLSICDIICLIIVASCWCRRAVGASAWCRRAAGESAWCRRAIGASAWSRRAAHLLFRSGHRPIHEFRSIICEIECRLVHGNWHLLARCRWWIGHDDEIWRGSCTVDVSNGRHFEVGLHDWIHHRRIENRLLFWRIEEVRLAVGCRGSVASATREWCHHLIAEARHNRHSSWRRVTVAGEFVLLVRSRCRHLPFQSPQDFRPIRLLFNAEHFVGYNRRQRSRASGQFHLITAVEVPRTDQHLLFFFLVCTGFHFADHLAHAHDARLVRIAGVRPNWSLHDCLNPHEASVASLDADAEGVHRIRAGCLQHYNGIDNKI